MTYEVGPSDEFYFMANPRSFLVVPGVKADRLDPVILCHPAMKDKILEQLTKEYNRGRSS